MVVSASVVSIVDTAKLETFSAGIVVVLVIRGSSDDSFSTDVFSVVCVVFTSALPINAGGRCFGL